MQFSFIDAVLNDKWDVLKTHVEKLAAKKIVEKISAKQADVLKLLNNSK